MTGKTHIMGGITASLAVAHAANENPLIMVGAGIAGALLPDICHSGSRIGRRFPILSRIINLLFGHRTFTHSLLFLVIVSFLIDRFFPNDILKYGLLTGMVSHYILDMATRSGIKLFFPLDLTVRFPLTIRTGSKVENLIFSILALLAFYFGYETLGWFRFW
ncbi:metal-dependent hydrolase [Salinicoccus luteus]|uniref:metal-dependent hydrolase n=1 Tax=Salinicoccus luteus TaxID=367840 RepID=UPI0004E19098|nr:metal-dependent hydrolase [Salinicoccus luteus]